MSFERLERDRILRKRLTRSAADPNSIADASPPPTPPVIVPSFELEEPPILSSPTAEFPDESDSRLRTRVASLEKRFADEFDALERHHNMELEEMKREYERRLAEMRRVLDSQSPPRHHHQQQQLQLSILSQSESSVQTDLSDSFSIDLGSFQAPPTPISAIDLSLSISTADQTASPPRAASGAEEKELAELTVRANSPSDGSQPAPLDSEFDSVPLEVPPSPAHHAKPRRGSANSELQNAQTVAKLQRRVNELEQQALALRDQQLGVGVCREDACSQTELPSGVSPPPSEDELTLVSPSPPPRPTSAAALDATQPAAPDQNLVGELTHLRELVPSLQRDITLITNERNQLHRASEALFRVLTRVVCASQEAERIALGVQPLIVVSASASEQPPADAADLVFSRASLDSSFPAWSALLSAASNNFLLTSLVEAETGSESDLLEPDAERSLDIKFPAEIDSLLRGIASRVRAALAYLSGQVEKGREACRRAESERGKLLAERSLLRDSLEAAERRVHELQCETRHLRGGSASGASALGLASPNVLESSPATSPNRMPSPILQLTPIGNRLAPPSLPVIEIQECMPPAAQQSPSNEQSTPKAAHSRVPGLLSAVQAPPVAAPGSDANGSSPTRPQASEEASVAGSPEDPNMSTGSLAWDEHGTNTPLVSVESTIHESLRSVLEELESHVDLNEREKTLLEETARLRERCELNELQYERHLRALRSEKHALEQRVETIVEEKHGICVQHAEQLDRLHEEIDCLQKQLKKMKTFIDEQTSEREQERDDYHRDVRELETRLEQLERERAAFLRTTAQSLVAQSLSVSSGSANSLHAGSTLLDITPTVNGVSASTKSYSSMSSSRGPADSLGGSYEDVSNKRSNLSTTESTLTAHTLEHSDDEDGARNALPLEAEIQALRIREAEKAVRELKQQIQEISIERDVLKERVTKLNSELSELRTALDESKVELVANEERERVERMKSVISRAGDRLFSGLRGVHAMAMLARFGPMDSTDSDGSTNSPAQRRRSSATATGRRANSDDEDYLVEVPATQLPSNGHMTNGDAHHHQPYSTVPLTIEEIEVERPVQQAHNDLLDQLIIAQANVTHLLKQNEEMEGYKEELEKKSAAFEQMCGELEKLQRELQTAQSAANAVSAANDDEMTARLLQEKTEECVFLNEQLEHLHNEIAELKMENEDAHDASDKYRALHTSFIESSTQTKLSLVVPNAGVLFDTVFRDLSSSLTPAQLTERRAALAALLLRALDSAASSGSTQNCDEPALQQLASKLNWHQLKEKIEQITKLENELADTQDQLLHKESELKLTQEQLSLKDSHITKLNEFQGSLQIDFDQVQALLEERSASLLKVQQELADAENTVGARYEKALDELKQRLEDERRRGQGLEEELRRTRETIAESAFNEREEEIFGLKEEHEQSRIRIAELESELESLRLVLDSPMQAEPSLMASYSSAQATMPSTGTPPPNEQQTTGVSKERDQVLVDLERIREELARADVERTALLERVRTLEAEKQQTVSAEHTGRTASPALDVLNQTFLAQLDSSKAECDKLQTELTSIRSEMLHWKDKALQFQQQSMQLSPRTQQQSPSTQLVSHDESASKAVVLDQISPSSVERELRAIQAQYSERLRSLITDGEAGGGSIVGLRKQIINELEKTRQQDAEMMHSLRDQLLSVQNSTTSTENPFSHHCCCSSINVDPGDPNALVELERAHVRDLFSQLSLERQQKERLRQELAAATVHIEQLSAQNVAHSSRAETLLKHAKHLEILLEEERQKGRPLASRFDQLHLPTASPSFTSGFGTLGGSSLSSSQTLTSNGLCFASSDIPSLSATIKHLECELDSERTKRLTSEALCDQHASDLSRARLDCENLQRQVLVLERARVAAEKQVRDVRHDANSLFKLRHTIEELKTALEQKCQQIVKYEQERAEFRGQLHSNQALIVELKSDLNAEHDKVLELSIALEQSHERLQRALSEASAERAYFQQQMSHMQQCQFGPATSLSGGSRGRPSQQSNGSPAAGADHLVRQATANSSSLAAPSSSLHAPSVSSSSLGAAVRSSNPEALFHSNAPPDERLQLMYTYYLRAEAFRRALAYQKRYLILLLGGFQQSEREILMALVHLGSVGAPGQTNGSPLAVSSVRTGSNNASASTPTRSSLLAISNPAPAAHPEAIDSAAMRPGALNGVGVAASQAFRFTPAFMRFRAAARVPIGVFRLRMLVRKWSRAFEAAHNLPGANRTSVAGSLASGDQHRQNGSVSTWLLDRSFQAIGTNAISAPRVDELKVSARHSPRPLIESSSALREEPLSSHSVATSMAETMLQTLPLTVDLSGPTGATGNSAVSHSPSLPSQQLHADLSYFRR